MLLQQQSMITNSTASVLAQLAPYVQQAYHMQEVQGLKQQQEQPPAPPTVEQLACGHAADVLLCDLSEQDLLQLHNIVSNDKALSPWARPTTTSASSAAKCS